jgi:hypothetical protein
VVIRDRALELDRPLGVLVLIVAALALAGAANAASVPRPPVKPSPMLLWKTYPLVQRPASDLARSRVLAAGVPQTLSPRTQAGGTGMLSQTMVLVLVGSLIAAFAGLLMVRSALAEFRNEPSSSQPRRRLRR